MRIKIWMILFAALCGGVACPAQEQRSALPEDDLTQILEEAVGAASVYNYERAEKLCDSVLSMAYDKDLKARAWWLKAVAYANFELQYRTRDLDDKYKEAVEGCREWNPDMLNEILPRFEVSLKYHTTPGLKGEEFLKQALEEYENKTEKNEAVRNFKLGVVYYALASSEEPGFKEKSEEYNREAMTFFQKAWELWPENYQYAAYYLTLLVHLKKIQEAETVALNMTEKWKAAPLYSFEQDAYNFLSIVVGFKKPEEVEKIMGVKNPLMKMTQGLYGPEGARKILEDRARMPEASADIFFDMAMSDANMASSDAEKSRILSGLVRRMEEGEIKKTGYSMKSQVSAYYKLAHSQFQQGLAEEALASYRKLAALSSHYAEIHYNQGIIFKSLAEKEKDPEKKKSLLDRAKQEFDLQIKYNWLGKGAENAKKALQTGFPSSK